MPTLFELVLGELSERVARIDRPIAENLSSPDLGVFQQYLREAAIQGLSFQRLFRGPDGHSSNWGASCSLYPFWRGWVRIEVCYDRRIVQLAKGSGSCLPTHMGIR